MDKAHTVAARDMLLVSRLGRVSPASDTQWNSVSSACALTSADKRVSGRMSTKGLLIPWMRSMGPTSSTSVSLW